MKKIIEADQGKPYEIIKNRFLYGNQAKELIYIVKKNIPDIEVEEIVKMFKSIEGKGCTYAMLANILVKQIYVDDEEFQNIFGFSLKIDKTDKIDCNKLLVDIYSKLYGVMKSRFIEYEIYSFDSIKEAIFNLLSIEFSNDSEATLALFNEGIIPDGFDLNGRLLFKNINPIITYCTGTAAQIAKDKFGLDGVKNIDELKSICSSKGIVFEYKDLEISEKLSGLGLQNFNFWSNYYLKGYNVDFTLIGEEISVRDFKDDYYEFMNYINKLVLEGYSISVGVGPNSNAYMHTKAIMSWSKIASYSSGHAMTFKCFNKKHDIIVSSYGKDFIIPKEFFSSLDFAKIKKDYQTLDKINNQKRV